MWKGEKRWYRRQKYSHLGRRRIGQKMLLFALEAHLLKLLNFDFVQETTLQNADVRGVASRI